MQLRTDEEDIEFVVVWPEFASQLGILESRLVAHAQKEALGALDTEGVYQLTPEAGHGGHLHQQHALLGKPDFAVSALKTDLLGQIVIVRILQVRLVAGRHDALAPVVFVGRFALSHNML